MADNSDTARRLAALTEAYHTAFDIKDEAKDAGQIDGLFYACYEATNHLADLIGRLGGTPPNRFDGEGRPPGAEPPARPLVLVIEQPDEDPDVLEWGEVDVWYDSGYPSTRYAFEERIDGEYDDYAVESRRLADEAEQRGAHKIAAALRGLAQEFEEAVANDPK